MGLQSGRKPQLLSLLAMGTLKWLMYLWKIYAALSCLVLASCSLSSVGSITTSEVNEESEQADGGTPPDDTGPDGGGSSPDEGADAGPELGEPDAGFTGMVDGEPSALTGITNAHNNVRAAHGVAAMVWDNELAAVALAWANNCAWGHNDGRSENYPGYVGENIYGASFVPTGEGVTSAWASEEAEYDYATNSCSGVCGHYTQIVWANSTKLGCAIANCPNIPTSNFVVCNYSPGGNYNGESPY